MPHFQPRAGASRRMHSIPRLITPVDVCSGPGRLAGWHSLWQRARRLPSSLGPRRPSRARAKAGGERTVGMRGLAARLVGLHCVVDLGRSVNGGGTPLRRGTAGRTAAGGHGDRDVAQSLRRAQGLHQGRPRQLQQRVQGDDDASGSKSIGVVSVDRSSIHRRPNRRRRFPWHAFDCDLPAGLLVPTSMAFSLSADPQITMSYASSWNFFLKKKYILKILIDLVCNFLNSLQDLDIAIVKATNHVECPPKERHLRSECLRCAARHVLTSEGVGYRFESC